jgi:hypothetical protein
MSNKNQDITANEKNVELTEKALRIVNSIEKDVYKFTEELFPEVKIPEDCDLLTYATIAKNHLELNKLLNRRSSPEEIQSVTVKSRQPLKTVIGEKDFDGNPFALLIRDRLRDEIERRKREKQAKLKKPILKPLTTNDGFLRAVADPINQHIFEAVTPGAMLKSAEMEIETNKLEARGMTGLREYSSLYVVESNKKDIYGVIGYKKDVGEALWEFQQEHGALALQVHIALFARAYAETDARPGEFITLRMSDFCDDLQFAKKKGAHRRETKERILGILECLTRAQMKIMYTPKEGKAHLFTGEIWQRGITHQTADQHADLFKWEPETFNYAPGQYFAFNDWRNYTRNVAYIGEGLLKLNANNDKWAIHGGGYLALLSRMNKYQKKKLSVKLLLEKTGLLAACGKFRKTSEMERKLIHALETLEKVGVIESWNWLTDSEETFAGKLATDKLFNQQIEIVYPNALKRIEDKLTDNIAAHKTKNKKKTEKVAA